MIIIAIKSNTTCKESLIRNWNIVYTVESKKTLLKVSLACDIELSEVLPASGFSVLDEDFCFSIESRYLPLSRLHRRKYPI